MYRDFWENSASIAWTSQTTPKTATYFGPDMMRMCGSAMVASTSTTVLSDNAGHSWSFPPASTGTTSVECSTPGLAISLPPDLTDALFACAGLLENCTGDAGQILNCSSGGCPPERAYCCRSPRHAVCVHDSVECQDYQTRGCQTNLDCTVAAPMCCVNGVVYPTCQTSCPH
jgi:hypothetical protein